VDTGREGSRPKAATSPDSKTRQVKTLAFDILTPKYFKLNRDMVRDGTA
jgi:hypothetical protein